MGLVKRKIKIKKSINFRAFRNIKLPVDALNKSYDLQKEEEAASKLSIMRAYDHTLKKVEHDQFAANIAADAKRMTKPTLMPAPPKPLSIPRAVILDPMVPIYGPEPIEGVAYSGGASGANDFADSAETAIINKRGGGIGLILGRKAFQKPFADGVKLLNVVQDVFLDDNITIA